MTRDEFMDMVYSELHSDGDNYRANRIIDAADEYVETEKALEQEPCEDAVSRNAIIKTLNEMDRYIATGLTSCKSGNKYPQNEVFIVDDVYEQIAEHLPSVTTRPKTGHWIKPTFDMIRNHICGSCEVMCSSCNEVEIEEYDYCPNCGTKMVEPQEREYKE